MFHKMLGNYQVASQLVASQVVLSSMELVNFTHLLNYYFVLFCHYLRKQFLTNFLHSQML
jgi:hypothetical protein